MSRSRSKARHCAVQAVYEWQMTGNNVNDIYEQFIVERNTSKFSKDYFKELLYGVIKAVAEIDDKIQPYIDRPIGEVDPVERAILRLGVFELVYSRDVPYRVAINEAVEAAKLFGAEQGHKYVNGVLDKVAQKERVLEVGKR